MNLRFLHLTDIHFHHSNYNTVKMRDELIKYIDELKKEKDFDFLLVTGDIANKGGSYNDLVKTFLHSIVETMNITKADVHLIPGNHDITRGEMRTMLIDSILRDPSPSEKLDSIGAETYQTLINAQSNFFAFYNEFFGEEYPKEKLHFVKSSNNYNVFSINTCLISDKQGEEGHLLIGKRRFYDSIRELSSNKDQSKLNIAIGHHTLGCIEPSERRTMQSNFDDAEIDLYISGHVHDPSHNITLNTSDNPFVELVSGAIFSDSYAVPGFVVVDINLEDGNAEACYHIWNTSDDYWSVNNQVSRRTRAGKLDFKLERLSKKKESEIKESYLQDDSDDIDENEFKQFIIDFHEKLHFEGPTRSSLDNKIELEKKFYNMKCSPTFKKRFDRFSQCFGTIYSIMDTTSYVSSDKKDLIADIIIDKYLEIHNHYNNGDEIFTRIVDQIILDNGNSLPYSKLMTQKYVKILTAWSIFDCDIFNEDKRCVEQ
ncbi:metallophosphoesterase [Lysinibacillus sphaericus]|uniref:metallophosphoesterase family protein n=1 Tax=Lysinibacillus sphaericus TaxID=1421 RepID=UPI0018CDCDEC|nr:metallophosphoesterase [Lysinibacillus sphaericus]MBG9453381.1 metallophosphoesterase [Lysinibacillus sphaericus]MBG9477016.1 metallophosphoesterase [Lysinibacillus sphaericus]MBG9591098.1 metallophosphoesterase [Lysinibacillus sphaericus]